MYRNNLLIFLVILSFIIAAWLPLHSRFYTTPAYSNLIKTNTERYLIELASRMIECQDFSEELSSSSVLSKEFIDEVEYARKTVGLWKIKIFSPSGEIIYSSDPVDIGTLTRRSFFAEMMQDGKPRTSIDEEILATAANKQETLYLVETYLPITKDDKVLGAFEIYLDITETHNTLHQIKATEEIILFPIVIGLVLAVLLSSYYANKSMAELKRSRERFRELSNTDGLTGLFNRRGFINLVNKRFALADRDNQYLFLIFVDIDDFKGINDTFGHDTGNEVLIEIARLLSNTFRRSDIIGRFEENVVGRLGGDEFAILISQAKELQDKEVIRRRLEDSIRQWNEKKEHPCTISLSFGISSYSPESPCSIDELLRRADDLMYAHKQRKGAGLSPGT